MALRIVSLSSRPPVAAEAEPGPTRAGVPAPDDADAPSLAGALEPGLAGKLLIHLLVEERTGRLALDGAVRGTLFFSAGEPVHLAIADGGASLERRIAAKVTLGPAAAGRHPLAVLARRSQPVAVLEALREEVRDFCVSLLGATSSPWAFFDDEAFLDWTPLTPVSPFGLALDARRRALPPADLLRLAEEMAPLFPTPHGGFANVTARLKAFTGHVDLGEVVDGRLTTAEVLARVHLDPMMGGLVLSTLVETGLLQLLPRPRPDAALDRRRRAAPTAAPVVMQADPRQLSQLAGTPGRGTELLSLYLELKPERDVNAVLGLEGSAGPAAVERQYQQRLAELDPRALPEGASRPYLVARAEELRAKVERAYQARMSTRIRTSAAYQLLDRIGAGGMAEVFRGTPPDDPHTLVAIKCILPELRDNPKFSQMFLDEARLARRIQHPNVVRILTVGKGTDDLYLAMEYVDGLDFSELVKRGREQRSPPSVEVVCRVIADACAGLHAAHTARDRSGALAPILHRDVSPQNILISRMGDVKLSDFGIAKAMEAGDEDSREEAGSVKGKIPYLAPELLKGEPASPRSDVYAMAMTAYAALARLPFNRSDRLATMRAILHDPLPPLSSLAPGVPPIVDALFATAAARNPEERHASAQQLQLELEEVLAQRPSVDVGSWARPLVGKRSEPGAPTRPITSIKSATSLTGVTTSTAVGAAAALAEPAPPGPRTVLVDPVQSDGEDIDLDGL